MKKYFILAVAACAALAACSKAEVEGPEQEIGFQVAKYMPQTKAKEGTVYAETQSFGSFALYHGVNAADNKDDFMSNVEVAKVGSVWKPANATYYWPKTGSLDFISVSPYAATPWATPKISGNAFVKLETDAIVTPAHAYGDSEDLMYSDVAVNCVNNTNEVLDGVNAYNGVPTFFRHALAKVNFQVALAYDTKVDGAGDKTTWEVTVGSIKIANVRQSGTMSLNGYNASGVWNLPTPAVWTPNTDVADLNIIASSTTVTTTPVNAVSNYFVMPQHLADDETLEITYTIKTYRNDVLFLSETNIVKTGIQLNLAKSTASGYPAVTDWEMSHNYTYILNIAPSKAKDTDGDGIEETPVEINFDPAVDGWTNVTAALSITI